MSNDKSLPIYADLEEKRIINILDGIVARVVNNGEKEALPHMRRIIDYAEERGIVMKSYRDIYLELREEKRL